MYKILEPLSSLPDGPAALMVRHAERYRIEAYTNGFNVPLTDRGHADALQLGGHLAPWSPIELWHSPAPRCADTARRLAEGAIAKGGQARVVGSDERLLGPYLRDVETVLEIAQRLGRGFLRQWFDGHLDPSIIQGRDATARGQLDVVLEKLLVLERGLVVVVSHDWNILSVRESYMGVRHEDIGWLSFLDGVAMAPAGGDLWMANGQSVERVQIA